MFLKLRQGFSEKSTLTRNTAWMLVGQGLKLVVQALYFTIIARSLGPRNYGAFVGVAGLVGVLLPFATLGSGFVLIKNVSRDPKQFKRNWGAALLITFLAASALLSVVMAISHFVLPATIPMKLVLLVGAADLFGTSIAVICAQAFMAFERLKWTASIAVLMSATRLAAAAILAGLYAHPTALQWASFYFGSTCVLTVVALALVVAKLGLPSSKFSMTFAELREGLYFSVGQSAQTVYNDIDKTMLARLGTLEATGTYGAAYRLIDVSLTPVASLLAAAFPNFFRIGASGISAAVRYAKPLIMRALGYAAIVSIVILAGAGIVPYVFGGEYRPSVEALRWLSVLPAFKVVHFFFTDVLSGAGHQGLRTLIHVGAGIFNVLINLWIIPAYSWRGAAWSSILSDALLACATGLAVFVLSRCETSSVRSEIVEESVKELETTSATLGISDR